MQEQCCYNMNTSILCNTIANSLVKSCFINQLQRSLPALVLDLDDTLVYASPIRIKKSGTKKSLNTQSKSSESTESSQNVMNNNITSIEENNEENEIKSIRVGRRRIYIQFRPGLFEFIHAISNYFEIYFFTSSTFEYGNQIIDLIDPTIPSSRRLFRDSCKFICGYPVKDLSLINYPLSKVVLVDDTEGSALLNPNNLIRIDPWNGNLDDNVLLSELVPALTQIMLENDLLTAAHQLIGSGKYEHLFTSSF
ncbi:NLI interacting factor-like phosphatase family protein [Tritrichomonas foetus]|uniref:Mitochondrial import inner membrane translocase subunit TIM50 n=1 Tax=Tritrichomonas foetus TaxID=1144522 RepID=A0A1J4J3V2_9EUKA|nr:NLI interacting factor-like phosphatase family protein [Tritrichomonas foetus]|eukprot:OHS92839.1 NLI interacting factor-like phosphatase family protein [Tritrichomonas foetus]